MLHLLDGFLDAGRVTHGLSAHLLKTCHPERLATFDVDAVHDYRSRRPIMTFDTYRWTAIQPPVLAIDRLTDALGHAFLLMHGQEPDGQWERMAQATLTIASEIGVGSPLHGDRHPDGRPAHAPHGDHAPRDAGGAGPRQPAAHRPHGRARPVVGAAAAEGR